MRILCLFTGNRMRIMCPVCIRYKWRQSKCQFSVHIWYERHVPTHTVLFQLWSIYVCMYAYSIILVIYFFQISTSVLQTLTIAKTRHFVSTPTGHTAVNVNQALTSLRKDPRNAQVRAMSKRKVYSCYLDNNDIIM